MKKFKTAFLNCGGEASINYVYNEGQRQRLAEIADLLPGVCGVEDIMAGRLSGVEIVFSTWGMPSFTEQEIRACLPALRCVFYAAGSVQGFAIIEG